jgi:hypothetical protein
MEGTATGEGGRYQVEVKTQSSDIWKPVCYASDLSRAERYAGIMLRAENIRAMRVVDQETGQVWLVKTVLHNPDDSGL